MAGGIIYTKTIDPQYQDGVDNNLIIQPNYAYQNKFEFGDDWTEIFVGMFFSYTFSVTNDNMGLSGSGIVDDIDSGGTDSDTFSYIGIIKDNDVKYLPDGSGSNLALSSTSFFGSCFKRIAVDTREDYDSRLSIGGSSARWLVSSDIKSSIADDWYGFYISDASDGVTKFSSYVGMKFKINDYESSTPTLDFRRYNLGERDDQKITDISLLNLKNIINSQSYNVQDRTFVLYNGSEKIVKPDSFFFYNAFLDIRPRIHAVAVKKIS